MPVLALIVVALLCGTGAWVVMRWLTARHTVPPAPAVAAGLKLAESARGHRALRSALRRRLDPEPLTGLALSIALLFTVCAGSVLGSLAYLVRTNARLAGLDNGVARWGSRHASPLSTHLLTAITQLGSISVVVVLADVLTAIELYRTGSRSIVPFMVAVVGGEEILDPDQGHRRPDSPGFQSRRRDSRPFVSQRPQINNRRAPSRRPRLPRLSTVSARCARS